MKYRMVHTHCVLHPAERGWIDTVEEADPNMTVTTDTLSYLHLIDPTIIVFVCAC